MPTYEYQCKSCEHAFELFQSMKDSPKKTCPKCKKATLERLIGTGAAVIFKGSGFYQTDYRSESYKKAADAETPAETKTDAAAPTAKTEAPSNGTTPAAKEQPKVRVPAKTVARKSTKKAGKSR
jgi:putative FmdB family regulatory protein